jgi:[ribosomal protein S5]-alanine N-acetyltransferase
MRPPEILETRRLRLRLPSMADAAAIFSQYAQDIAVTKYLTWRPHKQIEETYDYLRRCLAGWDSASAFTWVLTPKASGELLGMVEIRIGEYKADLGYVLARSYWGHGFMPEAVGAVVDWAMSSGGIFRVWAVCDVENSPSARVLEKVGMQKEGLLRRWISHPNVSDEPRDCFCYSKTR